MKGVTHVVGIDEVGRGPLAGPVTLCACMAAADFGNPDCASGSKAAEWFSDIRDSKKLSEKKREEWFVKAEAARDAGLLTWVVVSKTAEEIDRLGIAVAIREALGECLEGLMRSAGMSPAAMKVFLDGSLYAPAHFSNQETIIKGDEKIPLISIASIIAKVTRDRHMNEMAAVHPEYGFEKHKGYGTAAHVTAIKKFGPTALHRRSFLRNILPFS